MSRNVEIAGALAGAAIGAVTYGPIGGAIGALCGFIFGIMGRNTQRGLRISNKDMREMESALHLGIAASWAMRPITAENNGAEIDRIADFINQTLVQPFALQVTVNDAMLENAIVTAMRSGVAPFKSLRHVKQRYAPRFMRSDTLVVDQLVNRVLQINADYGNFSQSRAWFIRWTQEIGIGQHGERLWDSYFAGSELRDLAAERAAAIDAALNDLHDEAA